MEIRGEAEHAVLRHYPLRVIEVGKSDPSVRVLQSEFGLGMVAPATAPLRVFFGAQPESRLPQQLSPGHAKALESTHPDQVLDRGPLQGGGCSPEEIREGDEVPMPLSLLHHSLGDLGSPAPDEPQADPNVGLLGCTLHPALVDVGQAGSDTPTSGVPAQGIQRVEAHRLVVEECHVEFGTVVVTQPDGLIGQ